MIAPKCLPPRPSKPEGAFVWVSLDEFEHIHRNGGKAAHTAGWAGLVRMWNRHRHSDFRATVTELAELMGFRYRKALALLEWFERTGMIQISDRRNSRGCLYRLCKLCISEQAPLVHAVHKQSAQRAEVTSARHADSLQENQSSRITRVISKALKSENKAGPPRCADAPIEQDQPFVRHSRETEPTPDEIAKAEVRLSGYTNAETLRFVATNAKARRATDTLEELLGNLDDRVTRRTCVEVYAKGNAQKPPWNPDKRAQVLTARLKEFEAVRPALDAVSAA